MSYRLSSSLERTALGLRRGARIDELLVPTVDGAADVWSLFSGTASVPLPDGPSGYPRGVSQNPPRIVPGDIYEDCAFHPVLCTRVDEADDLIEGISLIDGSEPRGRSLLHCGVERLTIEDVVGIKADLPAYVKRRMEELGLSEE